MRFDFSFRQAKYLIVFLLFIGSLYHGMTFAHENWHREIYLDHGCEDVKINFEYFDFDSISAVTSASDCSNIEAMESKHKHVHKVQMYAYAPFLLVILFFELFLMRLFYSHGDGDRNGADVRNL